MTALDLRLLPVAVALWLGAACGLHASFGVQLLPALLLIGSAALIAQRLHHPSLLWIVALACGLLLAVLRVDAASPAAVTRFIENAGVLQFDAIVNGEPRPVEHRGYGGLEVQQLLRAPVTVVRLRSSERTWQISMPATLQWKPTEQVFAVGEQLHGEALLRPDDVASRSAYRITARGPMRVVRDASRGTALATQLRQGLALATHASSGDAGASLLPGLVLGDTRAQSARMVDDLKVSGLSHLTAVSGANLAIVIAAVMWLLRRTRIPSHHRHLLAAMSILGFVAVAQPQPSVLRAAMMGGISVFALASGERRTSASVLWLTVALLLILDPFLAWQYGFALSVAATAGLIVLRPLLRGLLPSGILGDALLVTVSAQLATLPILLMMGRPPTWLSVPANLLCEPLVAPATVLGFVAALLAALSLLPVPWLAPIAMLLASVVAWPAVIMAGLIASIAHFGAGTGLAVAPITSLPWCIAIVTLVLVLRRLGLRPRWLAGMATAYFLISACLPAGLQHWPGHDWWYVMCDVGQGDSSVFNLGAGDVMVIDAGPDPQAERECLRRLGVRHISALFITHFHADHVEGVRGLVQYMHPDRSFSTGLHEPMVEWQRTVSELPAQPTELRAGDVLRLGDNTVRVLWPIPEQLDGTPNNGSLVLDVERAGVHVLVTGDTDAAAESALTLPVTAYAVLKVPHHGSRYQDPSFLDRVHPALALISVGAGNDYGHPAPATIDALRQRGVRILRTDLHGAIAVAVRDGRLSYATLSG
ncbi:MAG: ComEC/Rec2 family competence protein [Candidatus Nanopelagicales bacterium]